MDQARVMNEHVSQKAVDTSLSEAVQELCSSCSSITNIFLNLRQGLTIGDKMNWDTSPQTGLFLRFTDFKSRKYSFSSPILSMQCYADVRASDRKQQTPKFERRGQGRSADSFVLWSYPIWVKCVNNFVADCLDHKSGDTSLRKLIQLPYYRKLTLHEIKVLEINAT